THRTPGSLRLTTTPEISVRIGDWTLPVAFGFSFPAHAAVYSADVEGTEPFGLVEPTVVPGAVVPGAVPGVVPVVAGAVLDVVGDAAGVDEHPPARSAAAPTPLASPIIHRRMSAPSRRAARSCHGYRGERSASRRLRKARPRWLTACFSSGAIS